MDRRNFLSRVVSLFSAGTAALMSLPVFKFLSGTLAGRQEGGWYAVASMDSGQLSDEVNQVTYNRIVREGWLTRTVQETVWVRRKPDGSVIVFEPHCTHLGCAYAWNQADRLFECPCHGGKYNVDGTRVDGPPPRPLDRYEIKMDGNILKIGRIVKS
ncbi:MAG TPA: ubiquinol-cytochrome c reductase iron-sulfur subunit [Acidobacteriota bacterium]|nr:ubiquinol-cytochrome c reductase iron-sulfur subunit [Acidobacteriota bacterium]